MHSGAPSVLNITTGVPHAIASTLTSPKVSSLVGLAKTKNLAPNEEETLNIKVNLKELTSYDVSSNGGKGGYILDEGNYYITAAGNAHEAINQILNKKAQTETSFIVDSSKLKDSKADSNDFAASEESVHIYNHAQYDSTSYLKATEDGETITNQFETADLEDGKYLSRSDWKMMENNNLRYGTVSEVNSKAEIIVASHQNGEYKRIERTKFSRLSSETNMAAALSAINGSHVMLQGFVFRKNNVCGALFENQTITVEDSKFSESAGYLQKEQS